MTHPDLLKILAHHDTPIAHEQLIAYLTGKLNASESHYVEERLAEAGLDEDALEGLLLVQDKEKLPRVQHELNHFLHQQLTQTKKKAPRSQLLTWQMLALGTAVLLAIVTLLWFAIYFLSRR